MSNRTSFIFINSDGVPSLYGSLAKLVNKNQEVIKHSIRWFRDNKRHPERKVVLDGPPYEGSDYKIYYKTVE